jgi:hypothetical protein
VSKSTTRGRHAVPKSAFALPREKYPVEDKSHAANAKARASQHYKTGHLTAADKAKVDVKADAILGKKGK